MRLRTLLEPEIPCRALDEVLQDVADCAPLHRERWDVPRYPIGLSGVYSHERAPGNASLIFLPSRAPELNPFENVRQFLCLNRLVNTTLEDMDHIHRPQKMSS